MKQSSRKQSLITGGLIGSAGIFISKLLGILYVIPFEMMVNDTEKMLYYTNSFTIYTYLISICTAGFPFAVATLVAKYHTKGDYKALISIKKIAIAVMAVFGFISMIFLMVTSGFFANFIGKKVGPDFINNLQDSFMLISVALFFVPILSSFRGFYQGLKEMEVYALSQVLEQISRVAFLLGMGGFFVYVLNYDSIWAVYFGIFSASFAAIFAIIHMIFYDRKRMKEIKREAKKQEVATNGEKNVIIKELIFLSIPYIMTAVLGSLDPVINTLFMINGLADSGLYATTEMVNEIASVISLQVQKLLSIPMILAPGFCVAIIPHITTALAKNDIHMVRKNVRDCVDTVLYIGIPVCFCLFVYATPAYGYLFQSDSVQQLEMYGHILQWYSIEGFLGVVGPIFTSLLMAVGLQKKIIQNLIVVVIIKFVSTYPLISTFGYPGAVISAVLAVGYSIIAGLYQLNKYFDVKWKYTFRKIAFMLIGCAGLWASAQLLHFFGIYGYGEGMGRIQMTLELALLGGTGLVTYAIITAFFQLPQTIFNIDLKKILRKVRR